MQTFFYDNSPLFIAAGAGLFLGSLIAGWLVRSRIKQRFEQMLSVAHTEQLVLQEKLHAHLELSLIHI